MYKLLRNTTNIPKPSRDWGKKPELEHITESDDLERLRIHRNTYAHPCSNEFENEVFEMVWFDISKVIFQLILDITEHVKFTHLIDNMHFHFQFLFVCFIIK